MANKKKEKRKVAYCEFRNEVGRIVNVPQEEAAQFIKSYPKARLLAGQIHPEIADLTAGLTREGLVQVLHELGMHDTPDNATKSHLASLIIDHEGGYDAAMAEIAAAAK